MFKVQNAKTGKFVKDACAGKVFQFSTKEAAEKFASSMMVNSINGATAWNTTRATKFVVVG